MIRYSWTILDYSPAYNQHYADHILEIQQHAAYQAIRELGLDFHECVGGVERHVFDRGDYEPIPVELPEDRISASPFGEPPY